MRRRFSIFALLACLAPAAFADTAVTVLYTNSANGILEPCPSCPNRLYGGLARRAAVIKKYRSERQAVLLLDAGDFSPLFTDRQRAIVIAEEMSRMGYDACVPGDQEFFHGLEFFRQVSSRATFPFLSATLVTEPDGKPLCPATRVKEIAGIKVGIVGITSPAAFKFFDRSFAPELGVREPLELLRGVIEQLRPSVNLLIVLSHSGYDEDEKVAREVPGIDLIVGGHSQTLLPEPVQVGTTLIVQAGKNAEHIGEATFHFDDGGKLRGIDGRLVLLNDTVGEDTATARRVEAYLKEENRRMEIASLRAKARTHADSGPALEIDRWEIDLGEVPSGGASRASATLTNTGVADLVIRKVRTSCECLFARLERATLKPGETSTLRITYDAEGISGPFADRIYLETNIPDAQVVWLLVKGKVSGPAHMPEQPGQAQPTARRTQPISGALVVEVFGTPDCRECARLKREFFPRLQEKFKDRVEIRYRDISREEEYAALIRMEKKYGVTASAPIEVFAGERVLVGSRAVRAHLEDLIEELLSRRTQETEAAPEASSTAETSAESRQTVVSRFRTFSAAAVILAGLIDGINPCAFATIVFVVSALAALRKGRREILLAGTGFTLGVFFAYLGLGAGIFAGLRALSAVRAAADIFVTGMAIAVFVLAALSFKDAWAYAKTRRPTSVTLQLPQGTKERMHRILKTGLGAPHLVAGSFVAGFAVSLLEAACTGQVYLPTLGFILREPSLAPRAWVFLVFYNISFILPLAAVFLLVYFGTGWQVLLRFLQRHLVGMKIAAGFLFAGLGVFLILTR